MWDTGSKIINRFPAGVVTPPPSKSLSHRALICAALAEGESELCNVGESEDISATLSGLAMLGAQWEREGDTLKVRGGLPRSARNLDCGESGSTIRFLLPLAALSEEETVFTGRGRLMERPLEVYETIFAGQGLPFIREPGRIRVGGSLEGGSFRLPGDVSSQFLSGLLFALPLLDKDSEICLTTPLESAGYLKMTVDVLKRFGIRIEWPDDRRLTIPGGQRYRPARYAVEADFSQAAYFLAAAALGREVRCAGLNPESLQGDRGVLRVLEEMGAEIRWEDGEVSVRGEKLSAVTVDAREIPDLVPVLAALCCFCEGESRILHAGRLRLKESDRLRAMAAGLGALGAEIQEGADSLTITGGASLPGGEADAWGDHRIAMAIAVAAIRCQGEVALTGWQSVGKSYPGFWRDFEREGKA